MAINENEQEPETQPKTQILKRTKSTESLSSKIIDAQDIGLELYTVKERGWPENMSTSDLTAGIHSKKYKGRYRESKYTEEQIMKKLTKNEINLDYKQCWIVVDSDAFRKIRPGINADRSPINRDPRSQLRSRIT